MKKYELTNETKVFRGVRLHRIRALYDFSDVHAGDLGGWVEKENNLSHNGLCWIYDNACACDNAIVFGKARICCYAHVSSNARVNGNAWIYDSAIICDNACVCGNTRISGNVHVAGDALINGYACALGNALICGNARISGDAIVCDSACVYDSALVYGNARVCGNACVFGDALIANTNDYLSIPNIGNQGDTTTFFKCKDGVIRVKCGCFCGSIDEFLQAVNKEHGDNKFGQIYRLAIEMARIQIAV